MRSTRPAALVALLLVLPACGDDGSSSGGSGGGTTASTTASTSGSTTSSSTSSSTSTGMGGGDPCGDTDIPEQNLGGGADPEAGDFTMDEALEGLPEGPGPLRAIIDTEMGQITCELFPEIAPIGVANFVGLARGRRPFEDGGSWIKGRRFYDGLTFHRVIDDFVAQGGDPQGNGFGGPGYEFVNEIASETHSPGTLAYANAGPDTNGSQFYIVAEVAVAGLDGDYTIFGRCDPVSVVKAITEVPTNAQDKPLTPVHTQKVSITRCAP
ncbi:MAG: peptidylprolyl isomerase [Myxococcales bacterium]|nr:peptidylprolyl isomerase [Myxococcales bacterium]